MLSFVSWQDDLSAESDDEEEGVSLQLQAQFVTFIDCTLCFKLYSINDQELHLLIQFKTQQSFFESCR